jgi:hypothetical protein
MRRVFPALLLTLLVVASAYGQNTSIYTSTRTSDCKTLESVDDGVGWYVGECKGTGGYKVQLIEGDIRQTLNVITPARKKFELNFWGYYSSFSAVGQKIEWRIKGGVPVALIARYSVSNPEQSEKTTSYLMVAKIGKTAACVTDVVKPGPGQNEEARRLADTAGGRPCKTTG